MGRRSPWAAGPRQPLFVARRRRRRPWPILLLGLALVPLAWLTGFDLPDGLRPNGADAPETTAGGDHRDAPAGDAADDRDASPERETGGGVDGGVDGPEGPGTPALARVGDLTLHLPARQALVVGYHEAAYRQARGLVPVGRLRENENTTKFDPPPDEPEGTDYLVLSSRGRVHPATSAVDVVMAAEEPVVSPVDGVVTDVRDYRLYDRHDDVRIEIVPHAEPGLRVVLIHLEQARVEPGDEVVAGRSPLAAGARTLSFGSHIDRYTEPERHPHVHLEVKVPEEDERGREVDDGPGPTREAER